MTASLTLLMTLLSPVASPAWAAPGKELFDEHCAACHTLGGGESVGPDLKGVAQRRQAGWLERMITEPEKQAAENDPDRAVLIKKYGLEMPDPGLSPEAARELLDYLKLPAASPAQTAAPPPRGGAAVDTGAAAAESRPPRSSGGAFAREAAGSAGSAANGRELFVGTRRLSGGGPACAGCHSVSGGDMAAGGTFAADLSQAFTKLGAAGIGTVLTRLPFPVKAQAFKGRAVTEGEIADLAAFLEETAKAGAEPGAEPNGAGRIQAGAGKLLFAGLLGVLCSFSLIGLIWNGRKKKGVKDDILSRQTKTG